MSEISNKDYDEQLRKLRNLLLEIKSRDYDESFLSDISHELNSLEENINSSSDIGFSQRGSSDIDGKIVELQNQLDSTVRLYEQSYERTRKILFEKQSKFDVVRLLSEEEVMELHRTFSERLLQENAYSIFLRNLIALERRLLERYKMLKEAQDVDINTTVSTGNRQSVTLDDIQHLYFSSSIVMGTGLRKTEISSENLQKIKESVLIMPEKIISSAKPVNYKPSLAPSDMVDTNGMRKVCCFKKFRDELKTGDKLYNIVHATSGQFLNMSDFLEVINRNPDKSVSVAYSDVDEMIDSYIASQEHVAENEDKKVM